MISTNVSKKTLNELDKLINDYKIRILDDIHDNFEINIEKQKFRDLFLERKKIIINRKKTPINYDKCFAIVYYKKYGYNQCKRNKNCGNYCNLHSNNRFYGDIIENSLENNTTNSLENNT